MISLEFYHFALEYCYGCQCDYVRSYNGARPQEAPIMNTWCGTDRPQAVRTTQGDAYVTFVSDQHSTNQGFRIRFRQENLAGECWFLIGVW